MLLVAGAEVETPDLGINPLRLLWDAAYDIANSMTSIVGLNPYQVVAGIFGLLFLFVIAQVILGLMGRSSYTLDNLRAMAQTDTDHVGEYSEAREAADQ